MAWSTISLFLKQAPALLAAADAVLARSRTRTQATEASGKIEALEQRLSALEHQQQSYGELAKQLAEHANAITAAEQATAVRARRGLLLASAAAILGLIALLVTIFRR